MNMQERVKICPECSADNIPQSQKCWLCNRPLGDAVPIIMAELVPDETKRQGLNEALLGLLTVLVITTALLVLAGASFQSVGAAIALGVILAPALIGVGVSTLLKLRRGERMSVPRSLLTFFLSIAVTLFTIVVLFFAAVICLCIVCIGLIARS